MTEPSDITSPNEVPGAKSPRKNTELEKLRQLLFDQQKQIVQLQERLDDPEIHIQDVERVPPEAIKTRASRDDEVMAKALEPNIDKAIRTSIKKNPKAIADTLFPIMGPAIRKAITTTLFSMIQSFNQILDHTFTIKGMKWRWEAKTTKRPLAEVVLLHSLIYQVEQIFLIHRKTGMVLQHVVAKEAPVQDPDMVSAMLTAILDFVQDSFGEEDDESIDTLQMGGGRSVWIEHGPHAMLAGVNRGTPPIDIRSAFREVIDEIHIDYNENLESFEGDTAPFDAVAYQLESCLKYKTKALKARRIPIWLKFVSLVALGILLWSYFSVRDNLRWTNFLERLNREPGIVVSTTEEHSGKYRVFGLRDPLASDPAVIQKEVKLEPGSVVLQLEPYHSLYPKFVFKRIKKILMPPETVTLELKDGILHAQGAALHQWIVAARELVKTIPGIVQYQDNKVIDIDQRLKLPETVNLKLKNGILHAEGLALHQWIVEAGELAKTIPGVVQLQDDKVIDIDQDVEIAKKKVEEQIVFFRLPGINIVSGQGDTLRELLENISKLNYLAQFLDKKVNIDIVGHTDSFGTAEENKDISLRRAQKIFSMLDWHDFKKTNFTAIGVGSKEPIKKENTEQDRLFNRSVTFRVSLSDNLSADKLDLKP